MDHYISRVSGRSEVVLTHSLTPELLEGLKRMDEAHSLLPIPQAGLISTEAVLERFLQETLALIDLKFLIERASGGEKVIYK